ncbi:MAG: hypothetical protein R2843_04615 [Thermomicrobiales bacterium]
MPITNVGEERFAHVPATDDASAERDRLTFAGSLIRFSPLELRERLGRRMRTRGPGGIRIDPKFTELIRLDPSLFLQIGELDLHCSLAAMMEW